MMVGGGRAGHWCTLRSCSFLMRPASSSPRPARRSAAEAFPRTASLDAHSAGAPQAGKPGLSRADLGKRLAPLGFAPHHLRALADTLAWIAEQVPPADCSSDSAEPAARAAEKSGSLSRRWRGGSQTPVLRNALKMCVFLLSWLGISAEKASIARPATQVPTHRPPCLSRPQSRGCVRMARCSHGFTFAAGVRRAVRCHRAGVRA